METLFDLLTRVCLILLHIINHIEHILNMLRLVLSVGILLRTHTLELVFVRNFDRPSSIEKLGAGIW